MGKSNPPRGMKIAPLQTGSGRALGTKLGEDRGGMKPNEKMSRFGKL